MSKHFIALGVSKEIVKTLTDINIEIPTEIQTKSIPLILNDKHDFVGLAKTGTGKTAAFGLPLLQLIDSKSPTIQVVILVPTRELGQQILSNFNQFSKYLPEISITSVCGGTPIKPQIEQLKAVNHIVIATPGRLIDLIQRKAINIKKTNYLVLDEADEMVTVLKEGLDEIVVELPINRRTLLFSATMSNSDCS